VVASLLMGMMVRSLVAQVPPAWEQKLGDEAMHEIRKQKMIFMDDPGRKAKLDQAVAPLVSSLTTNAADFKFYIIEFPRPNAMALPGGYVIVTSDLLDLADRPEEIAGVVAHELAHVRLKHGLRKIIAAAGPYLIFQMFSRDGQGLFSVLGNGSQVLVQQSFSQSFEFEADATGWDMLVSAHIDPRGMAEMLRKFKAIQDTTQGERPEIQALESHPATEKRIERLDAKWERLKNKSGFIDYSQATLH
jgi:predicted Zn-dependent protease